MGHHRSLAVGAACAALLFCSAPSNTAAQTTRPADDVVAVVYGERVSVRDLDAYWREHDARSFRALNEQLTKVRERMLDGAIGERLLRREAERLQMPVEELVAARTPQPSAIPEDELRQMYERSSAVQQGVTLEMARPAIAGYIQQQKAAEARAAFAESLRRAAKGEVTVYLEPERMVVKRLPTDPVRGDKAAPIEIVEFSDFECPFCAQTKPILDRLLREYAGKVKLVWKDLPLPSHVSALVAASAARCAGEQDRFWGYHDVLYANQARLAAPDLAGYARDLGLDLDAFGRCTEAGRYRDQIMTDARQWTLDGVSATPTVVIDGRSFTGVVPFEAYERAVRAALEK